jgi:excinuclease ABC subunit B
MTFVLASDFKPSGDQPQAIETLVSGVMSNRRHQVLLGVTGSGKTFTMANVIAKLNRPALVLAHNKTLAAQLCAEFKAFFPTNAVEYFVSYYDYYQPEAYVSAKDIYIEKEAQVNEEIERLRHSATRSLLTRRDVIIVASVSCIYGLGTPEAYMNGVLTIRCGQTIGRRQFLTQLTAIYFERNDIELKRGRFRVKGDVVDVFPSWDETALRFEFFGDDIDRIFSLHPVTGEVLDRLDAVDVFPASHYVVDGGMDDAILAIEQEMKAQYRAFTDSGRLVEAQRIKDRTLYDIEMMRQMGYCKGIENYARHLSGANEGEPPGVLLDFFPDDFLTIIDESHVSIPQIGGMYKGDRSRKQTLVNFGFRLPSALDNRPLQFHEFETRVNHVIYTSATPGGYELEKVARPMPVGDGMLERYDVVEQVIRPTGLLDPIVHVQKTEGQMPHLLQEIDARIRKSERVLVTAVTKKLSEDISDFLSNQGIKVMYLHSDIAALERIDILRDLRLGTYDVLVGVNLLREGLDLPEVSLVAILDADKEGFLRNERSLIQTMGRAARHPEGTVILYADSITPSMQKAVHETKRRRKKQHAHNVAHGITPTPIVKEIKDIREESRERVASVQALATVANPAELQAAISTLEANMQQAAENLEFELAAVLRDQLSELKNQVDLPNKP